MLFDPADRTSLGWAIRGAGSSLEGQVLSADQRRQEQQRLELAQRQLRRMEAVAEGEACREQALLLAVGSASAQTTATILGSIKDQSGAVLPGADVTATNVGTGISRSVPTRSVQCSS